MKKLLVIARRAVAVLVLAPAYAATKAVDITREGSRRDKVTIHFGDTVMWTNKDTVMHQVLADQAKFPSSPMLSAGPDAIRSRSRSPAASATATGRTSGARAR